LRFGVVEGVTANHALAAGNDDFHGQVLSF
jgi:hypothetical protein